MSDETKCRACGKYNGPDDSSDSCHCPQVRDMDVSEDTPTPPTPDPRERGECECNESGFAQSECIRNGCRATPPARQVGAEFSVCVWCDARVEWTASADRAEAEARLREHSATCPAHPAVIALRALHPAPAPVVSEAMVREAVTSAIEQAVASCVEQAEKRLPTKLWRVDYAGILGRVTAALTPDAP